MGEESDRLERIMDLIKLRIDSVNRLNGWKGSDKSNRRPVGGLPYPSTGKPNKPDTGLTMPSTGSTMVSPAPIDLPMDEKGDI